MTKFLPSSATLLHLMAKYLSAHPNRYLFPSSTFTKLTASEVVAQSAKNSLTIGRCSGKVKERAVRRSGEVAFNAAFQGNPDDDSLPVFL